jgi:alpha-L-rhamnosidase
MNKELKVTHLRCEYKVDPLGIDVLNPRLSWIIDCLNPNEKRQKQTAYQIIVSSAKERATNDIADLWDSGKVFSDQSSQVEYAGKKLVSGVECWWKVRIWDVNDSITEWSEFAKWSMGMFSNNDWKAKWIGYDEREREAEKKDKLQFIHKKDKWIWYPLNKTKNKKGIGEYFFRKIFELEKLNEIFSADILITGDEQFVLYINEKKIEQSDSYIFSWARPKQINVKSNLKQGKNVLAVGCINTYLEKPGLTAKLILSLKNGKKEIIRTDKEWKVSDDKNNDWKKDNFDDESWIKAEQIASIGDKPWRIPKVDLDLKPPKYLRKEFNIKKEVKTVYVYVSSLGLYKLFINGQSVSEDRLTPGWTDYNKRVYYNTYNVKKLLKSFDKNCLGIIIADGWYAGYIGWEKGREYYGKNPLLLLQLEIEYMDGTTDCICSDELWESSHGPIQEADLLMGETYNSKKENDFLGWNQPGFNAMNWERVEVSDKLNIELNSYPTIPIRKTLEIKPVKISSPQKGIYIYDLGQNIAGCVRLKIDGRRTDRVTLRFGEMLDNEGNLYMENIRMARSTDTYFTKGDQEEIWEPYFTYHGFRYVELSGYHEDAEPDMITGIIFHSDIPVTGSFECSNKKLNKLYENILWSQRANFMDIPTDCPQRDERLGWTADAVDFIRTASFNMDTASFYTKWLTDLNDARKDNGAYTAIAPQPDLGVGPLYSGAAGWADAGIITPYTLYKFYGDKRILEKYYVNMLKYMDYLETDNINFIRPDYGYGDWLSLNAETPRDLIATAYFAYDSKLMMEISAVLKKGNEAKRFEKLFVKVKNAFNKKYISRDGSIKSGTQTAYVLALHFGLLQKEKESKAFGYLVEDIIKRDFHISTGFAGLTYLFPALTKFDRSDIVYKVLLNDSFPSWLYMIKQGATTLWERWDSWTPDKGFFDPLMNSFNHTSLGVIGDCFYAGIGGIIPEEPGFKKIIIRPLAGGGLDNAKVSYSSINGKIISEWKIENGKFFLKVGIPVNVSAKIFIPKSIGKKITDKPDYAELIEENTSDFIFKVGSGNYNFAAC